MKKTLAAVAAVAAIPAGAAETVKVVWPFGPVAATTPMRAIFEQANNSQKDYTFVLDLVTGGGGNPAISAVSNNKDSSILAHSSAFFINPLLAESPIYSTADWQYVDTICDVPLTLASKKYKSMADIPKDRPVSVGIRGLGSTGHLLVIMLKSQYPNLVEVPYNSASQMVPDAIGGHVDLIVAFPGDTVQQHKAGDLKILAVSGSSKLENIPTLASMGFAKTEDVTTSYFFAVPKSTNPEKVKAWQAILRASKPAAKEAMETVFCKPVDTPVNQLNSKYEQVNKFWAKEIQSVKK